PGAGGQPPGPALPAAPGAVPPAAVPAGAPSTIDPRLPEAPLVYASASTTRGEDPGTHGEWAAGVVLLLGAAALSLLSRRRKGHA
ncbi:hypothetical protein, partial [Nocardioides sp. SYSU D00038]|uniref:hypothetical protein n=1 Tax=Nocardioides sp. SYSU D00038 TaxID=2812554 RepID=UPI001968475D